MAKSRYVDPLKATHRDTVPMRYSTRINQRARDGQYLYYVKPSYSDEDYDMSIVLLAYRIEKETAHFYLLECGMRVWKKFDGKTFAHTPQEALHYGIKRTENYYHILYHRLLRVQQFLKETDIMRPGKNLNVREMRIFEELTKKFDNVDDMPSELFKDFADNPDTRLGDILNYPPKSSLF